MIGDCPSGVNGFATSFGGESSAPLLLSPSLGILEFDSLFASWLLRTTAPTMTAVATEMKHREISHFLNEFFESETFFVAVPPKFAELTFAFFVGATTTLGGLPSRTI